MANEALSLGQYLNKFESIATLDRIGGSRSDQDAYWDVLELAQMMNAYVKLTYNEYPAAKNIASAPAETDLAQYQPGGANEKLAGFEITVTVIGGTGSAVNVHTLDTVGEDTFTVGGVAASVFTSRGAGSYRLRMDPDNNDWIFVDPDDHAFDTIKTSTYTVERKIDGRMEQTVRYTTTASNYTAITFFIAFLAGTTPFVFANENYAEGASLITAVGNITATTCRIGTLNSATQSYFVATTTAVYKAIGYWR